MASKLLQRARDFEKNAQVKTRPQFHLTPRTGWMNDPNGFSRFGGKYHLFYQYYPYARKWGLMHWGHAVSDDMVTWEYLPAAMAADMPYDNGGCYSGSALELPEGRQVLMYTGVEKQELPDGTEDIRQTQCIAFGDGVDYEKADCNPVIRGDSVPEGFSSRHFRDPHIFAEPDGTYGCVVGDLTEDGSGAILLYRSRDCIHWDFVTVLDRCRNEYGRMWECPDFFQLDGRHILLVSPQDMVSEPPEFHNGHNALCVYGTYDRKTDTFTREGVQGVDFGLDFYAPQTLLTEDGRRVMIGWMQNWGSVFEPAENKGWFGQMTSPRELRFAEGRLLQQPVRELEAHRRNPVVFENVTLRGSLTLPGISGRKVDMTVTLPDSGYESFEIRLAAKDRFYTSVVYTPGKLTLSRENSGLTMDFLHSRSYPVAGKEGKLRLRILVDTCSVEVFAGDGEAVLSTTIYTPEDAEGISFIGSTVFTVEKYDIV